MIGPVEATPPAPRFRSGCAAHLGQRTDLLGRDAVDRRLRQKGIEFLVRGDVVHPGTPMRTDQVVARLHLPLRLKACAVVLLPEHRLHRLRRYPADLQLPKHKELVGVSHPPFQRAGEAVSLAGLRVSERSLPPIDMRGRPSIRGRRPRRRPVCSPHRPACRDRPPRQRAPWSPREPKPDPLRHGNHLGGLTTSRLFPAGRFLVPPGIAAVMGASVELSTSRGCGRPASTAQRRLHEVDTGRVSYVQLWSKRHRVLAEHLVRPLRANDRLDHRRSWFRAEADAGPPRCRRPVAVS